MRNKYEVNYRNLKMTCNPNMFDFETTENLKSISTGIGQERGIKALEFGVNVEGKGYNLYIEGPSGVGKTMYTKNYLDKIAPKKKVPQDWCYIYNFQNPNEPIAVSLPAGQGREFKDSMEGFIKEIKKDIKATFNNDDFEKEKALIKKQYEEKRESLMNKLGNEALKFNFQVKSAQNGIYMMPVFEGRALKEEEFDKLEENIKSEYEQKSEIVQQMIMDAIGEIKSIERESDKKISEWQSNVALLTVNVHINYLKSRYRRNKKINNFLNEVKQDVLKNVPKFLEEDNEKKQQQMQNPMQQPHDPCLNYRVNLFVDNSNLKGAPVIMDSNYSFSNIFGKLEYENFYGALKTDYTMLQAGLLQKANGGYILFQAKDLLQNPICYENLKKVLRIKEISIDSANEQRSSMVMVSLKPEPIPLDLKVLLIGDANIYYTLFSMDEDFRKLFKIKVEWEDEAPITRENVNNLARIIHDYCEQEELLPLDKYAMSRIVEYASKMVGDQRKISTAFNDIFIIVAEASTWAKMAKSKLITENFIEKALVESKQRVKKYDEKYSQMIKDQNLLTYSNVNWRLHFWKAS